MSENSHGRDPDGSGSHPTGGTSAEFPSLRDVDPSRETPAETEARMYDAGRITGHYSDPDGSPDIGYSVGLGGGKMLWIGEISERLFSETGAAGSDLGGSGGTWFVVYGQCRGSTYVLGKALNGVDANAICCAVSAAVGSADASSRDVGWGDYPGDRFEGDLTLREAALEVVNWFDKDGAAGTLPDYIMDLRSALKATP